MKRFFLILTIVAAIFVGALISLKILHPENSTNEADFIHEATAETGNIPEKIVGDPSTAKVILYEYADYGCSHCAEWNKTLNDLVKEHPDDLAIVFRAYDLGYKNGRTVALAATAAQTLGYWKEYKDLLFLNQNEWFYASAAELEKLLTEYFLTASGGAGDTAKFLENMQSEAVKKRVDFENLMGEKVKLRGTPTFRIDGQTISPASLLNTIQAKPSGA